MNSLFNRANKQVSHIKNDLSSLREAFESSSLNNQAFISTETDRVEVTFTNCFRPIGSFPFRSSRDNSGLGNDVAQRTGHKQAGRMQRVKQGRNYLLKKMFIFFIAVVGK